MARKLNPNPTPEQLRQRANYLVDKAVRKFQLPRLSQIIVACVDCGERATEYDHRDYRKPLEVEPVCRKCNGRRGPGKPWPEGYEGKPRRQKQNGDRWNSLDEGEGNACDWFTGHCIEEPDEKLLLIHETFRDEYRWSLYEDPDWFIVRNELWRMSKERRQQKFGEFIGIEVYKFIYGADRNPRTA